MPVTIGSNRIVYLCVCSPSYARLACTGTPFVRALYANLVFAPCMRTVYARLALEHIVCASCRSKPFVHFFFFLCSRVRCLVMAFCATGPTGALGQMAWRELGEKEKEEYITKAEKVRAIALTYRHTHHHHHHRQ